MSQQKETREIWINHVRTYVSSGLSQAEFCRKNNLRASRLCYYHKLYVVEKPREKPLPSDFVELKLPSVPSNDFALHLPNGIKVEVPSRFEAKYLANLIAVLKSC